MTRIYGHKWSSIAESDDGTWLDGLSGITPDQVSSACSRLMASGYHWPPSLPEFLMLCLNVDDDDLQAFIRQKALEKFDSFYIGQLSQKAIDRLISNVREKATADYVNKSIMFNVTQNSNRLLEER